MLSESRRKLKWSQDPQNTLWTNNTTAFGHKMLKKMGWEKGKGLGANEDGVTEPVKLNANKTTKGLGCAGYDNTWVAHQDDFSALLLELNNDNSSKTGSGTEPKPQVAKLEESSKSQRRLHYKKFTRGKDLSNYNEADMTAIFGLQTQSLPPTPLHGSDDESDELNTKNNHKTCKPIDDVSIANPSSLIPADCSVTEYFKMKLEKLKQQRAQKDTSDVIANGDASCNSNVKKTDDIITNFDCNLKSDNTKTAKNNVLKVGDYFNEKDGSYVQNGMKRKKKSKKLKSKKKKCD